MWKIVFVLSTVFLVSACSTPHPQAERPQQGYYIVQPGDNIYSIAFMLEMSPERLRRANPWLNPVNIAPGMRLSVPRYPSHDRYASEDKSYDADQVVVRTQHTDYIWPVNRARVSSRFGYRRGGLHAGIDLPAPRGTRIYASAAGRIVFSGYKRRYGHMIIIDHGNGIETVYAHNNRNLAKKDQNVKQGQVIATVGRSGNATGYHVHFEFRRFGKAVNPNLYVQAAL